MIEPLIIGLLVIGLHIIEFSYKIIKKLYKKYEIRKRKQKNLTVIVAGVRNFYYKM